MVTNSAKGSIRTVLYLRLSDGRNENGSFDERKKKLIEKADALGWEVARVVIENDMMPGGSRSASAFKRRKIVLSNGDVSMRVYRPGFRSILDDLRHGRAEALLAEDLDRAMRDPRDLEDLIDVVEQYRCSADSLSGSLKFTRGGTDSEITMARLMVTIANKSSRDTARRVTAARERQAREGRFGGGKRPYGWGGPKVDKKTGEPVLDKDGKPILDYTKVVREEAERIRDWADAVLANVTLRDLARYLREAGVSSTTGRPWTAEILRQILLRPRHAGLTVYRGEVVGSAECNDTWLDKEYPILPRDTWEAVVHKLTHPDRGAGKPGAPHRWLGSGIYQCHCGSTVTVQVTNSKSPAYRCKQTGTGHSLRNQARVDDQVEQYVVALLARPDAADLLQLPTGGDGIDLGALRTEERVLSERKANLATDYADGVIDRAQLASGTKRIEAKLATVRSELAAHTERSVLPANFPLGGDPEDVAKAWADLRLHVQREVIRQLVTVTIMPTGQRGRSFDPESVAVRRQPKRGAEHRWVNLSTSESDRESDRTRPDATQRDKRLAA